MVSGMAPILALRTDGPGHGASHGLSRSRGRPSLLGCAYLPGRSHSGLPWFSGFSRALSPPMPEKISLTQTLPVTVSRTAMVAEFSVPHAAI